MLGLILVVIGVFFLLKNVGIIQEDFWIIFWPVLVIFSGLFIADKDKRKKNGGRGYWPCFSKRKDNDHKVVDGR